MLRRLMYSLGSIVRLPFGIFRRRSHAGYGSRSYRRF